MKLDSDFIIEAMGGAVGFDKCADGIMPLRFTSKELMLYKERSADFYDKAHSGAGMKLSFETNSRDLFLSVRVSRGSSRKYFSFDVFKSGELLGYLDNFSHTALPENYTAANFSDGEFAKHFSLGEGTKNITVYFPWSASVLIKEISVDDGAFLNVCRRSKKIVFYGDSITQGYDALRPSNRYAAKLSDALCAEEINKAIGGEVFFSPLAELCGSTLSDAFVVAYGTNDWSKCTFEDFLVNCKGFFGALRKNHPEVPIICLTPIWRKDAEKPSAFGDFCSVGTKLAEAVSDIGNITVADCSAFVPHDEKYYADKRLHPNDNGFDMYFRKLFSILDGKL